MSDIRVEDIKVGDEVTGPDRRGGGRTMRAARP